MKLLSEVVNELERLYPNDVYELKGKTEVEREVYIAKLEMIEFIRKFGEYPKERSK